MPNQRESFQNLDRDHGVSVFGKSKGKREEGGLLKGTTRRSAQEGPLLPMASHTRLGHALLCPRVLLPGSASRSRSPASSAATSWTPVLPTARHTGPAPARDERHPRPRVMKWGAPSLDPALRGACVTG